MDSRRKRDRKAHDESSHAGREPFTVQSDALDPELTAELELAFRQKETVRYEGSSWLVQKVEAHRDHGPGTDVKRFTLIPAEEAPEDDGADRHGG